MSSFLASPAGSGANGGRRTLVTGAGSGLGLAVAQKLAAQGHQVIATVRDPERARDLTEAAARKGLAVRYLALQLTDEDQIAAVAAEVEAAGGVDTIVNNAGFGVFGPVEEVDGCAVEQQFAVNLFGPLALTRKLLPGLRARRGRVIWIGSLAGRIALPFQSHYSATKAAVASISDAMRLELAPHGVTVTCVEPGDFATGFTGARVVSRKVDSRYSEVVDRCLREVQRQETTAPDPEWVARVVAKLVDHPSPPPRVPVGSLARTTCMLQRLLPARLWERIVRSHYRV